MTIVLPKIDHPMTYAEIEAALDSKSKAHLKRHPFDLSIALMRKVNAKKLEHRWRDFKTRWPVYGSGRRVQPLREPKKNPSTRKEKQ